MASALIALLAGLVGGIGNQDRPLTFGHDLIPSYVAGRILLNGDSQHLYNPATAENVGNQVMSNANLTGNPHDVRWLNPPCFALLFAPLAALPYRSALLVWLSLNGGLFGGVIAMLSQSLLREHRRRAIIFAAVVVASCPFLLATEHQQNTFLSLAILSGVVLAWRGGRPFIAGLLAGILVYKPQLAVAISVALIVSQGWRALLGVVLSAGVLTLLGEIAVPGGTIAFVHDVPAIVRTIQSETAFNWGRHVTPTSFWCALLGRAREDLARGLGIGCSVIAVLILAIFAWRSRSGTPASIDRLIVATFLFLPLSAIYLMDYDLLLLAIPAAIVLRNGWRAIIPIAFLYFAFYFNLFAVEVIHINIAIVAIALSAANALTGGTRGLRDALQRRKRRPTNTAKHAPSSAEHSASEGTGGTAYATPT
jgi:hypothetical protein